ncbi:uncharacterized protein LOC144701308 [Wolffia australiana]
MRRSSPLSRIVSKDPTSALQSKRPSPKLTPIADQNGRRPSPCTNRRSPRTPLQEIPARNQNKINPRGSDLEAKLSNAQEALRKIKLQLDSAEAATLDVQLELAASKKLSEDESLLPTEAAVEAATTAAEIDRWQLENERLKRQLSEAEAEARAAATAAELDRWRLENERLKRQLAEAETKAVAAEARANEAELQLTKSRDELAEAELKASQLQEQLQAVEWTRAALDAEMSKTRVQAEQWRKAAEAAAAVLTPAEDTSRQPERLAAAEISSLWSPPLATIDPEMIRAERKISGIRTLREIWKKGSHKSS